MESKKYDPITDVLLDDFEANMNFFNNNTAASAYTKGLSAEAINGQAQLSSELIDPEQRSQSMHTPQDDPGLNGKKKATTARLDNYTIM